MGQVVERGLVCCTCHCPLARNRDRLSRTPLARRASTMMRFSGLVRSRLSRRIWLTVLLLSIAVALVAQTPDTASLRGRVIDQSRASVAGARVVATNSLSRIVRSAQTDEFGYFSLAGLPITGTWSVAASKSGFADGRAGDLTLEGGTGANITLQLSVAGGQTL